MVNSGALNGLRVLDLTTVVMGPAATQILGDLGADVIKVEQPDGDSMRGIGPFRSPGMGPLFLQANRNKRSVCLDLKSAAGKESLLAIAKTVDVLVSNIRPSALERLGLSYAALSADNPGLIFCSAVGYGSGGPQAGKAVYDDLMQAASGLAGLFGRVDGAPRYAPINICDRVVGLYVVIAVVAALQHRNATGQGQNIEVPMFETMAQFVLSDHIGGEAFVPAEGGVGYRRLLSRTRGPYPTQDGYLSLVVYTNTHWRAFTRIVGCPELLDTDARFATMETRTRNAEDVGRFLAQHLADAPTAHWLTVLGEADIPACRVNDVQDLFEDPHLVAVGMFGQAQHPTEGTIRTQRFPVTFSKSPASIRRLAPRLGEHTEEVLAELQRAPVRRGASGDAD